MFRMQPNPVQSEGTLRNMVDMETGKDAGGNPDGEGILAPSGGHAILTAFIGDELECPTCHLRTGEINCPRCGTFIDPTGIASEHSGVPAELRPQVPGAPLTEGTIMGTEHTDPYDTGAHGRDEYAHSHVIASLVTAEHQGYTNWETWHTKLMLDNERHLYEHQKKMTEEGWTPEQIRDWTVQHVIGPENKRKLEDAREWNEIPEPERTDPHYEEVAEKSPQHKDIMESWFGGPDLSDTSPNLIDPELVNWDEIHHNIHADHDEDQQYEEEQRRLQGQGLDFAMPGHKDETNQMLDAWMKHHGVMGKDQKTPEGHSAEHHTMFWVPKEHLEQGGSEYQYPRGFGDEHLKEIDEQGGFNDSLRSVGWNAIHHLQKGLPTPYGDTIRKSLETAGYPPEQIQHIMRPQSAWNEDQGAYLPIEPKPQPEGPDPRLDQPGKDVFPSDWTSKTAGEMEDLVYGDPSPPKTNLNWTPGMKGRGIVIGGEPHTWNAYDPNAQRIKDIEASKGPMHTQYVESLGVNPKHVDWNTGIEIDPDGKIVATGDHDPAPFIAADPRLKHVEENFFPFGQTMPPTARTNNMEPYESLWGREADVQFDQGPLQNTPSASPAYSVVVQPSDAGVHGAHTGRKGLLSFLDAHINGIPVRGHGGELISKYGFRSSPDFGKQLVVGVHDPTHLPVAVESLQHPAGHSTLINDLVPKIQSGEVPAPPGIDPQTLQPLPGAMPESEPVVARTASLWSTLGEAALPIAGLALAPETGGASLALDAGEAGALLGGEAAGAGAAGAAEGAAASGASGTAGGLMSKAMSGAGGVAKAEGVSSLVNQGVGMAGNMLGAGGGQQEGGGGGYSGPLQQFTHVLAAFVEDNVHPGTPDPMSQMRCPHCQHDVILDPSGKDIWCSHCNQSWPVRQDMHSQWAFDPQDILETDALKEDHSLFGPVHHGKTADYETPSSVPDIGVKHDDPEDVDQKEFNDQDKSPENLLNPNLQDSGASGEDQVRKDMDKPSQGQFSPDGPGMQRMEMLMPLIEKYYHSDESGADDPMLKGLHEMLDAENPGYLNGADTEAAERFMHNKKTPEHVHAGTVHEAIMPPMQQGNLQAQQQALDPTGLNPSMQPQPGAPSSQTPPGGGAQQGHCATCGGVTQADGSCPQCGAAAAPSAQPLPGGPSQVPHPQTFAHTDLLASLVDSANHQGPVTPEQVAAVQQYLIQEGRVDEVPNVPLDPGNPEYAKILAEIQKNPTTPPTVTPEEQTQPPAPQPAAPGGMPVPGMAPGESGGQPMQPMSSFLPDFTAADNIAPRCPKCGSGTTGLVGDQDHNARCHSCHNVWKLDDLVSDENYGQTSIAKTALRDERQHGGQGEQANPVGVPAAEQEGQMDQGGDEDSSLTWKDSTGAPLKAGQQYQMVNPTFALPDLIRVERVKPDGIDVTLLGTYANDPTQHDPNMLTSSTPISRQDMELQKLSFEPINQTADDQNNEPPPGTQAPGHAQVPPSGQTTDEQAASEPQMAAQSSVDPDCPRCGHREFTSAMITAEATEHNCFYCGHDWVTEEKGLEHEAGVDLEWLNDDDDADDLSPRRTQMARAAVQSRSISDIAEKDERLRAVREHLQHEKQERVQRVAGKHFTPREQRELIDEDGIARNSDMLDLAGTHYRVRDDYESKTNPERVRDADLFLGI